jgi:hypothetical protein
MGEKEEEENDVKTDKRPKRNGEKERKKGKNTNGYRKV